MTECTGVLSSPTKPARPTEAVRSSWLLTSVCANTYSFQPWKKAMTAAAARVGADERDHDRQNDVDLRAAVDPRRFLDVDRHAVDRAFQNPGDHRDGKGRVGEDEAGQRVEKRELREDRVERHDQHRLRQHLRREQGEAEQTLSPEAEARQRVGRQDRERDAEDHGAGCDDGAVRQPGRDRDRREDLLVDRELIERRQESRPRREQLRRGRQRRDEHPVDREGGTRQQREHREHAQGVLPTMTAHQRCPFAFSACCVRRK